ncbi:hypothetical protein CORC01_02008 [Colletotrichum orchidophilum]|uniref:Uncharacterized protein n=1 Tax=Colletotrichum orchidophilum TaxID=1209926 RepID=A0A1G4BMC4_9PEZI|nr:uncharacterized protein CORC01_02008 [Colletotrichum orchidophilum]OHF02612.1 hypothetical protein CORC01_02008 [Colletotrichum orchidophilum]
MDRNAQMEAAKLLASEFKRGGGGSGRGRSNGRGRTNNSSNGSKPGGIGKAVTHSRYDTHAVQMNRSAPASSRPKFTQAEVTRARIQSPTTRVDPSLSGWLTGSNTPQASTAIPAKKAAVHSDSPKGIDKNLASWLTNTDKPQPSASTPVPATPKEAPTNRPSSSVPGPKVHISETLKDAVPGNVHAVSQTNALPLSLKKDDGAPLETIAHSKPNGLGKSLWAAHETNAVKDQDRDTMVETAASTDLSALTSALLLFDKDQPATRPQSDYDEHAARLLETVDTKQDAQASATMTEGPGVQKQPEIGSFFWALWQLEAGRELPDPLAVNAQMAEGTRDDNGVAPITDADTKDIKDTTSTMQRQETDHMENATEPLMNEAVCNCSKRSHPVIGLAASRHNTDADGNLDVSGLETASTAVKNKFAVNVILYRHSNQDCPVLLKYAAKFPLHFGASPALVDDPDDHLQVIRWEDSNSSSGPSSSLPGPSHSSPVPSNTLSGPPAQQLRRDRGLNASIWAA